MMKKRFSFFFFFFIKKKNIYICFSGLISLHFQISVSGTPCRGSVNTCDLPEYCNGSTSYCPSDFYIMDGLLCENNAAYCYEGRCQTYDYQCKQLFEEGWLLYKMNTAKSDTFDCRIWHIWLHWPFVKQTRKYCNIVSDSLIFSFFIS